MIGNAPFLYLFFFLFRYALCDDLMDFLQMEWPKVWVLPTILFSNLSPNFFQYKREHIEHWRQFIFIYIWCKF